MPTRDKLWIALLASLVIAQVLMSFLLPAGRPLMIASDLIQAALLLIATAAFLPNCLESRSPTHRTRAFWILMTGGMAFWLAYQGMWNYFEVLRNQDVPNPFLGDIVLFLHLVPMMAALAVLPHLGEEDREARLRYLDFALLLIWWVFVYVYAVIPWQTVHVHEPTYSDNYNVTYLTEKLVLLLALVYLTYHARGGWRYLYANLLGASALYASSSYIANYAISQQTYYSGSLFDIPLVVSVVWLATVGRFANRFNLSEAHQSQPLLGVWITRLGMLALFSLPWLAVYAQVKTGSPPSVQDFRAIASLVTMIAMGILVFLRQRLLGTELALLLKKSHSSFEDLKSLQAQLIQSEKLASLGQLVGGAAHEINNPLTAMMGYSDLLSASDLPPQQKTWAERIAVEVRRTRTLVGSLLTFVRQAPAQLSGRDVNSIVQTAMRLLTPQFEAAGITLHLQMSNALPLVQADSNQLLHVCLHLAGQISGRSAGIGEDRGVHIRTGQARDLVAIEFSRAPGVSEVLCETLKDLEARKKRGSLSLGACCRIVEEHGGRILAESTLEGYSAFRVELPAMVKSAAQAAPGHAAAGA